MDLKNLKSRSAFFLDSYSFFSVILLPYVSTLEKSYSIDHQLTTLSSDINKHSQNIYYLKSAEDGLQNLNWLLTKFPSELDKSFINLKLIQISLELNNFTIKVNKFLNQPQSEDKLNKLSGILSKLSQQVNSIFNFKSSTGDNFTICNKMNTTLRTYCNLNEKIHSQIEQFVNILHTNYGLKNTSYLFPICDIKFHYGTNEWADCNLNEKIHSQIEQFNQVLLQNVSSHLKSISNNSQLSELQELQNAFNDLKNHSYKIGPNIYSKSKSNLNTTGTELSQLTKLSDDVRVFQQARNKTIEPTRVKFDINIKQQGKQQDFELKQLNATKMLLLKDRYKSILDRDKIEARLNQTQFPFGKLPINLDESVAAFPLALGIGFILSASYLAYSIHLRKELHNWYKVKYKDTEKRLLDQRISLIAPLWIDPINSKTTRIFKFIIFIIPFIIFILSCYMIFYYIIFRQGNQILSSLFSYESFSNAWTYVGLYLICTGFFIYGTLNTLREIRRYK
jgi:hypothetical protein